MIEQRLEQDGCWLFYNITVPLTQEPIILQLRGEHGTAYRFRLTAAGVRVTTQNRGRRQQNPKGKKMFILQKKCM